MRVALAGLGSAAFRGHLPAIARLQRHGRLALVGAADPDPARRAVAATRLDGVPLFADAEKMLAAVGAEVLVVASSPDCHGRLIDLGARHGKHVVCEKPLTLTAAEYEAVASTFGGAGSPALVPVHQYRYSPTWRWLARAGRLANRLRRPFSLDVDVWRDGSDRGAVGSWRTDPSASGGMLADHGVHFLALGWTISPDLEVVRSARHWNRERRERSAIELRLGSGRLRINLNAAAPDRSTKMDLRLPGGSLSWHDSRARVVVGGRTLHGWSTAAISDRAHIDTLHAALYGDLTANLGRHGWRTARTGEAMTVGRTLVVLLERDRS